MLDRPLVRLLQRYILIELLRVFLGVLSALTVLLVFVGAIRNVQQNELGPFQVLHILPYLVPSMLPFTIPATMLLTVCVVYGRIAADHEVTAAKAAGINALSLLWPSFLFGGVLSVCALVLTDQVIPWAVWNIQTRVTQMMEEIFLDVLRTHHNYTDPDRGISIAVMDVVDRQLISPVFQYTPQGHAGVAMRAQEASLNFDLDRQQVNLHLVNASVVTPGEKVWLEEHDFPFPLPHDSEKRKPRHLSIHDIRQEIRTHTRSLESSQRQRDVESALALALGDFDRLTENHVTAYGVDLRIHHKDLAKLHTEIHSRFALSCSCLFFALLGGPFAILQARRQFLTSFFICFLPILILYYPIVLLMMNLAKTGTVNPAWAMWLGNFMLLGISGIVLKRVLMH